RGRGRRLVPHGNGRGDDRSGRASVGGRHGRRRRGGGPSRVLRRDGRRGVRDRTVVRLHARAVLRLVVGETAASRARCAFSPHGRAVPAGGCACGADRGTPGQG